MSDTQGKLTKTYNPYLYLFEKGEWGITPFITTILRLELRSTERQSVIITFRPYSHIQQLFTLRSSCRTVYFISTIISGDDGQGVIRHPCRTSHNFASRSTTSPLQSEFSQPWVLLYHLVWRPGPSGGCSLRHYAQSQFILLIQQTIQDLHL